MPHADAFAALLACAGIRVLTAAADPPAPPAGLASFVASVLTPAHTIVVVVHEEAASQLRNQYEQALITPVLTAPADPSTYNLSPEHELGVVVPHRNLALAMLLDRQRRVVYHILPGKLFEHKHFGLGTRLNGYRTRTRCCIRQPDRRNVTADEPGTKVVEVLPRVPAVIEGLFE